MYVPMAFYESIIDAFRMQGIQIWQGLVEKGVFN